jgi:hypothetical protein
MRGHDGFAQRAERKRKGELAGHSGPGSRRGRQHRQLKPLSDAACAKLTERYTLAASKLHDCIVATQDPWTGQGDQNCQAFSIRLDDYVSLVKTAPVFGIDPAKRKGELASRADAIKYMFEKQTREAVRQSTLQ